MRRGRCIGILQPVYLPWIGYFEQIDYVDHFVFQDDVQYTKNDWRNRNRICTKSGPTWLIVPVKRDGLSTRLHETRIDYGRNWARKQILTVRQAYSSSPYIDPVIAMLESAFDARPDRLTDLTIPLIEQLAGHLSIAGTFSRASDIPRAPDADLTGRLLEIAKAHAATDLYLGAKGIAYVDTQFLGQNGVAVTFQNFIHPTYKQHGADFQSHMSMLDYIANVGPAGVRQWLDTLPKFGSAP
ncbi:WbqC family protein [Maricaulis sp.]|uniref:WbqC family protein n=1 Tax=Maricaulis sp. TaxID=1486257 RepID=UPI002B273E58|nr:WbqC family protein [Maricaulis sp.]